MFDLWQIGPHATRLWLYCPKPAAGHVTVAPTLWGARDRRGAVARLPRMFHCCCDVGKKKTGRPKTPAASSNRTDSSVCGIARAKFARWCCISVLQLEDLSSTRQHGNTSSYVAIPHYGLIGRKWRKSEVEPMDIYSSTAVDSTRPHFWSDPKTASLWILFYVLSASLPVCRTAVTKHHLPWETFWESISKLQLQELPSLWKHAEILQKKKKFKTYASKPPLF